MKKLITVLAAIILLTSCGVTETAEAITTTTATTVTTTSPMSSAAVLKAFSMFLMRD
jgi:uncharacterized lipoprotein YajG